MPSASRFTILKFARFAGGHDASISGPLLFLAPLPPPLPEPPPSSKYDTNFESASGPRSNMRSSARPLSSLSISPYGIISLAFTIAASSPARIA